MDGRLAARRDLSGMVDTLVDGFMEDPVFCWMYPNAGERPGQLKQWFATVAGFAFNHGHCYVGDAAAAIWVPPDIDLLSDEERAVVVERITAQVGADRAMTIAQGFGAAGAHRPEAPASMMLWYVAVRPGQQGRGLGEAVLRPVLNLLEGSGHYAYLHSTNGRNVPFYGRLGWQVLADVQMPAGGPVIRPMWRAPVAR